MSGSTISRKQLYYFFFALFLCIVLFPFDLLIPRGYIEWFFYLIPIVVVYRANSILLNFLLLGTIGLLLIIGYLFSPGIAVSPVVSITNRVEGFIAFLIFTLIINALIRSRAAQLRSNDLVKQKAEELSKTNSELEAFSYSVSHDLRSPLRAMLGFGQILIEDYSNVLDTDGMEYLHRIKQSGEKMETLIDDMLNLSKVSKQEMRVESVSLDQMAIEILEELSQSDPGRNVTWKVQDKMDVFGDKGLLRIALSNLLGNAWKYTGKTRDAFIEMGYQIENEQKVFFVRDNGSGFDMRHADKLFNAFQRLHSDKEFAGTGIGLAIVDRIIRRHNGKVWAISQIGEGSTFYFTVRC